MKTKEIIGPLPNTHCFSKRMAEELLCQFNVKKIPLVFIRPSIIGTTASEPMPGWTDTVNLLQGVALLIGLGIMRDVPGISSHMADIVPVDIVARHILTSLSYVAHHGLPLYISNCTSTSSNPTTWRAFFDALTEYQNRFPYEKRAGYASLTMHSD
jgi:fatty acyl-CoA reductase